MNLGIPQLKQQLRVYKNQIISICYCRNLDYQITIRRIIESLFKREVPMFIIDSLDFLKAFLSQIHQKLLLKSKPKANIYNRYKVMNQEYLINRLKLVNHYLTKSKTNTLLIFNVWKIFKRDFKKLKERADAIKEFYQTVSMIAEKTEFTLLCEEMLEGFHPLDCTPPPGLELISNHVVKFLPYNTLFINDQKVNY